MSAPMLTETRERFLIAILAQISAERVAEIHFFSPIKQGGVESGVAVVVECAAPPDVPEPEMEPAMEPEVPEPEAELELEEPELATESPSEPSERTEPAPLRCVVHTARYRLTLKGLDRGKWEMSVAAEADAPLATVEAVVRGVQRRSGDIDDAIRMDEAEVRAFAERRVVAV